MNMFWPNNYNKEGRKEKKGHYGGWNQGSIENEKNHYKQADTEQNKK